MEKSDEELLRQNAERSQRIMGEIGRPSNIRHLPNMNGNKPEPRPEPKQPNEDGEINFTVRREGDLLILDFGAPVTWFGLEREQLPGLIESLRKHYKGMRK